MKTTTIVLGSGYEKFKYPAGELQVRLPQETVFELATANEVIVLARMTSAEQIMELSLLWDAIEEVVPSRARKFLLLPYLPYARADRRFVKGDCFGLKVFSRLLSSLAAQPITLDAHSSKSKEMIEGLWDVSSLPLIEKAVADFAKQNNADRVTILFPDEGARKRYSIPDALGGISVHVLHCSKKREAATGKLLGFFTPRLEEFPKAGDKCCPVMIVDDICDGGGTFIGIADSMKSFHLPLALYVTHGIFSKGMEPLEARFDAIYTTDSFKERSDEGKLRIIPAMPEMLKASTLTQVTVD